MSEYNYYRTYKSKKGRFSKFINALPVNLTIQGFPHSNNSLLYNDYRTYFKEVSLAPYYMPANTRALIKKLRKVPRSSRHGVDIAYNGLLKAIKTTWKPGKFHLIPHSGGYDSRIISHIIKELRKEKGDGWLGDVLFIEFAGEGKAFKQIMERQGWERDKYLVLNEQLTPREYFNPLLDFENAWRGFNGVSAYPFNMFRDPFIDARNAGIIPQECQIYTGYGAYIEWGIRRKNLKKWNRENYFYQIANFKKYPSEWQMPFWNEKYLLNLAKIRRFPRSRISVEICRRKLSYLQDIKRPAVRDLGHYRVLSARLSNKLHKDFKNSWLGNRLNVEPTKQIKYARYWSAWIAASYCEMLIKKGHKCRM